MGITPRPALGPREVPEEAGLWGGGLSEGSGAAGGGRKSLLGDTWAELRAAQPGAPPDSLPPALSSGSS